MNQREVEKIVKQQIDGIIRLLLGILIVRKRMKDHQFLAYQQPLFETQGNGNDATVYNFLNVI